LTSRRNGPEDLQKKLDKTEDLLAETENRADLLERLLDKVVNLSEGSFYVIDPVDYRIILANDVGSKPDFQGNLKCHQLFQHHDRPCNDAGLECPVDQVKHTKTPMTIRHEHRDAEGNIVSLDVHAHPILDSHGRVKYVLELMTNVTESVEVEKKLRLMQFSIDHIDTSAIWMDSKGRIIMVNDATCKALDYTREELLQLTVPDIDPNFPKENWSEKWMQFKAAGSLTIESLHRRKDGTLFPVEITSNYLKFEGEEYNCAFAVDITSRKRIEDELALYRNKLEDIVDDRTVELAEANLKLREEISERRKIEEALRYSDKRFSDVAENAQEWIWEIDTDGEIVYSNRVVEQILGLKPEDIIGKQFFDLILEDDREKTQEFAVNMMRSKQAFRDFAQRFRNNEGEIIWVTTSAVPVLDRTGELIGYRGANINITEKKKAEDELLRTSKLESIGLLAGGIAHDFNNILLSVRSNLTLATLKLGRDHEVSEILHRIDSASSKAKDLTYQLLTFAKGGAPIRRTATIEDLIIESTSFTLRGSNVKSEFEIQEDLWPVEIDEGQISQVINNLAINAKQSMVEGGILEVSAENINVTKVTGLPLSDGKYVKLSFQDHGTGISEKILAKIFDPYFTTKDQGSGLGLATVYSIIKNHDGYIGVKSDMDEGTEFTVYLPASDEKPEVKEKIAINISGRGKILLMDDEDLVRESIGEFLELAGFEVSLAEDGEEAIEQYRSAKIAGSPFDVVIMDLTIPGGLGGKDTIRELLNFDPGIKAIVASGYSNDPIMSEFDEYGFKEVLAKPYEIQKLTSILESVINTD